MKHHDVARRDATPQLGEVGRQDLLVVATLRAGQRSAVAPLPVQHVVQPLGDREELRIGVQHQPSVLDARAPPVGEQGLQHLRHPTTVGGGVDVPHGATPEPGTRALGVSRQPCPPLCRQHGRQPVQWQGLNGHFLHHATAALWSRRRATGGSIQSPRSQGGASVPCLSMGRTPVSVSVCPCRASGSRFLWNTRPASCPGSPASLSQPPSHTWCLTERRCLVSHLDTDRVGPLPSGPGPWSRPVRSFRPCSGQPSARDRGVSNRTDNPLDSSKGR